MEIRAEQPKDVEAIYSVNAAVFDRPGEANLVNQLREVPSTFSFVAVDCERIVGHVFFSPVTVEPVTVEPMTVEGECASNLPILGLAPVAVLSAYQRQGIGSSLIRYGLRECAHRGFKAVVVLGSSQYYSRFGFVPAKEKNLRCEYPVPDEAFMVLELKRDALEKCVGVVKYHSAFDGLE